MKPLAALLLAACAGAQTFEVVSIKPSPPPDGTGMSVSSGGGPGSKDPSRWRCTNMTLSNIIENAFHLRVNELKAPQWMEEARFDIVAKVPEGATREQVAVMQQNMLAERFGLKYHRETKEVQGFELVLVKGGPKFKEAAPEPPPAADAPKPAGPRPYGIGADGYPVIPPGVTGMSMRPGRARAQWAGAPVSSLAANLQYQVGKPVVDGTGLTGKYDMSLYWVPDNNRPGAVDSASEPAGPNLFTAIQEQLGLKLEPKKVTIQLLVVDDARKVPTEN